jgi:WD40 repeat protein
MVRNPENPDDYVVQDTQGYLYRLDSKSKEVAKVMSFHSGHVAGICTSPLQHSFASLGNDGSLRLFDYREKTMTTKFKYTSPGTVVQYLPASLDETGRSLVCGFEDGIVRIVTYEKLKTTTLGKPFTLEYVFKPHNYPVVMIEFSEEGRRMATIDSEGLIFFFEITEINDRDPEDTTPQTFSRNNFVFQPIGFLRLDQPVTSFSFSPDNHLRVDAIEDPENEYSNQNRGREENGHRILATLQDGSLLSMILFSPREFDNTFSFEIPAEKMSKSKWNFAVPEIEVRKVINHENSDEEGEGEGEVSPSMESLNLDALAITADSEFKMIRYLEGGYFLAVVINNRGQSEVRVCKYGSHDVSRLIFTHDSEISTMNIPKSGKYILFAADDGMSALRKLNFEEITLKNWTSHENYYNESKTNEAAPEFDDTFKGAYWTGFAHSSNHGHVTSICTSFDDSFLVTVGEDGGMFVWRNIMEGVDDGEGDEKEKAGVEEKDAVEAEEEPEKSAKPVEIVKDITDAQKYTIQEEKVKSEKDREEEEAQHKKQMARSYIQNLRAEFIQVVNENENSEYEHWKLPRDALSVDVGLGSVIECETDDKIDLLRKDLQWTTEREKIGLQKLKRKFLDDISTETIEIRAFRCDHKVLTFRTIKLPSMKEISNIRDVDQDGKNLKHVGGEDKSKTDQKNDKGEKDLMLSQHEAGKGSGKVFDSTI